MWTKKIDFSQVDRDYTYSTVTEKDDGLKGYIVCNHEATDSEIIRLAIEIETLKSFGLHQQLAIQLNIARHLKDDAVYFAREVAEKAAANAFVALIRQKNAALKEQERIFFFDEIYNDKLLDLKGSYVVNYIYQKAIDFINNEVSSLTEYLGLDIIRELINEYKYLKTSFSLKEFNEFIEAKIQQKGSLLVKECFYKQIQLLALGFCDQIEKKHSELLSLELLFRLKQEEQTAAGRLPNALKNGTRRAIMGEILNYDLFAVSMTIFINDATKKTILSYLKEQLPEKLPMVCAQMVGAVIDRAITTPKPFISQVEFEACQLLEAMGLKSSKREREALASASILCSNIYLKFNPDCLNKSKIPISPIRLMDVEVTYNRKSKTDEFSFRFGNWYQYCSKDDIAIVTVPKLQKYHKTRDKILQVVLAYSERNTGGTTSIRDLLIEAHGVVEFKRQLTDRKKRSRMLKKFNQALDEVAKLGIATTITELGKDRLNHEVSFEFNLRLPSVQVIRQRSGKSQSELARELCMSRNRLSQIEKGQESLDLDRSATLTRLWVSGNQNGGKNLPP